MCLYPRLIRNKKYTANKKNGGIIPPVHDIRTTMVPVGCGKCMECMKQKARQWQVRLLEDIKTNKNGKFITLTFSTENLRKLADENEKYKGYDLDNAIATMATRRFLERWRKEYKKSLRHFLITELGHGETEHMHLHGIIWTNEPLEKIVDKWQYGYVWIGKGDKKENYVNERTVNYIIKYIMKIDKEHKEYKPIILTSPGIGKNYLETYNSETNRYKGEQTKETYKTKSGHEISLPIYYRNKLYSEEEREKLWLLKLDKQIRWVCGEKVSVKESDKEYWDLVKWYRDKNKELGYGDDQLKYEEWEYKNNLRNLKLKERLEERGPKVECGRPPNGPRNSRTHT